jgi:hypothetical protein
VGEPGLPLTLNPYIYGNDNPVSVVDPTGEFGLGEDGGDISMPMGMYFPTRAPGSTVNTELLPQISGSNERGSAATLAMDASNQIQLYGYKDRIFRRWFGGKPSKTKNKLQRQLIRELRNGNKRAAFVASVYDTTFDLLQQGPLNFFTNHDPVEESRSVLYVFGCDPERKIYVTQHWYDLNSVSFDTKPGALLHEAVHLGYCGIRDDVRMLPHKDNFTRSQKLPMERKVQNARNYQYYAEDIASIYTEAIVIEAGGGGP